MFNLIKTISFKKVSFQYNKDNNYIFKDITLNIKQGDKIGLIGKTGSGKSTILDLLIGLISPTSGYILIDDNNLHNLKNVDFKRKWQNSISHVPQSIYLSDSSIAQNIGFGIPKDEINYDLVKDAAQKAQIEDFINQLPKRFLTYVGERGVKLSGGQI